MSLSRWDAPNGSYTSSIPPGMVAFRKVIAEVFGYTRTEVIRDASRCRQTRSEHCECGGVDCFTTETIKGRKLFDACVRTADVLGVQSVIFQHRQIGFGNPTERHRSKADHYDHVHIGLNRWARTNLTEKMVRDALGGEEDDVTKEELELALKPIKTLLGVGTDNASGKTVVNLLLENVDGVAVDGLKLVRKEMREMEARLTALIEAQP